jgi:hypothetical protein
MLISQYNARLAELNIKSKQFRLEKLKGLFSYLPLFSNTDPILLNLFTAKIKNFLNSNKLLQIQRGLAYSKFC